MRSPVGWLCYGVVVVCLIGIKSEVALGNYHHVINEHGYVYPGPILQRIVPAIGYRSIVPQVVVRGVEARNDNVDEVVLRRHEYEYERGQEENEDEDEGYPHYSPYPDEHTSSEEEDNEHEGGGGYSEEDSSSEEEEEYEGHYQEGYYGRQTYRNNKLHSSTTAQTIPRKSSSNKIRTPLLQKNSSIADQLNQRKKINKSKKKKPSDEIPVEIQEVKSNSQNSNTTHDESNESHKQKYQLKSVASSNVNHFVATPIADLILRLSISLARPIGHGNGTATYLNVPIRLSNTGNEENNSTALNASTAAVARKVKTGIQKTNAIIVKNRDDPIKVITVPIKTDASDIEDIDDEEDGEDIDQV